MTDITGQTDPSNVADLISELVDRTEQDLTRIEGEWGMGRDYNQMVADGDTDTDLIERARHIANDIRAGIIPVEEWRARVGAPHQPPAPVAPNPTATALRELAADDKLLWEVARRAIEDALVDLRGSRISFPLRANGLVIREPDATPSDIIRMGPETAVRIALLALAEHLEHPPVVVDGSDF